jgi:hypothetical protein
MVPSSVACVLPTRPSALQQNSSRRARSAHTGEASGRHVSGRHEPATPTMSFSSCGPHFRARTHFASHANAHFLSNTVTTMSGSHARSIRERSKDNTKGLDSLRRTSTKHRLCRDSCSGHDCRGFPSGRELRVQAITDDEGSRNGRKKEQASKGNQIRVYESSVNGRRKLCAELVILARPGDVWKVLTDYNRLHEFMPNLVRLAVRMQTELCKSCGMI